MKKLKEEHEEETVSKELSSKFITWRLCWGSIIVAVENVHSMLLFVYHGDILSHRGGAGTIPRRVRLNRCMSDHTIRFMLVDGKASKYTFRLAGNLLQNTKNSTS